MSKSQARRPPRSARLALEALEARELLSISLPPENPNSQPVDWVSQNAIGVYYNNGREQGYAAPIQQQATASDGSRYFLDGLGLLKRLTPSGKWQTLGAGVSRFALDAAANLYTFGKTGHLGINGADAGLLQASATASDGSVYYLDARGTLAQVNNGSEWTTLRTGVRKFLLRFGTTVFALGADGVVYRGGSPLASEATDFALGSDGSLYKLSLAGELSHRLPGGVWVTVNGGGVRAFGLDPSDNVYAVATDGSLSINGAPAKTQAAATASDGSRLFLYDGGQLGRLVKGDHWEPLGTGIARFSLDRFGNVHAVGTNGALYVNGLDTRTVVFGIDGVGSVVSLDYAKTLSRFAPGSTARQVLDTNVLSFTIDKDGSVIELNSSGTLNRFAPGGMEPRRLDQGVLVYALDGSGAMIERNSAGDLVRFAAGSTVGTTMAKQVSTFVVDRSGSVVVLDKQGNLARFLPGSLKKQPMRANVQDLAVDGAGSVVAREAAGGLALYAPGATRRQSMGSSVSSFLVDAAGSVVTLDGGGNLFRYAPGSTRGQKIDSGVKSFVLDAAGSVVDLDSTNSLGRFAPGSSNRQVLVSHVSTYTVDGAGTVVALNNTGVLARFAPGSSLLQQIDTGVTDFMVDASGSVVALDEKTFGTTVTVGTGFLRKTITGTAVEKNILVRFAPGSNERQEIEHDVASWTTDGAGAVVVLDTAGNLDFFAPGAVKGQRIDTGVKTMVLDAAGSVAALEQTGTLIRFAPGSTGKQVMATKVMTVNLDASRSTVALERTYIGNVENPMFLAPTLVLFTPGSTTPHVMANFVLDVQPDHAGRLVVLANGARGDILRFDPGAYTSPTVQGHDAMAFSINSDDTVSPIPKPSRLGKVLEFAWNLVKTVGKVIWAGLKFAWDHTFGSPSLRNTPPPPPQPPASAFHGWVWSGSGTIWIGNAGHSFRFDDQPLPGIPQYSPGSTFSNQEYAESVAKIALVDKLRAIAASLYPGQIASIAVDGASDWVHAVWQF
jgi:hypothetical protein